MDIALNFKRAIATLSAGAIFATLFVTGAGNASADFSDVPASHWAYDTVTKLTAMGVFDNNPVFRVNDKANRAETVKVIAEAAGLMDGCVQPTAPTFKDYASFTEWYVKYFECAAAAGVVTGDTGPNGERLGTARPGANLLRSEALALVVRAFNINPANVRDDQFSDDVEGAWYGKILDQAATAGIIVGDQGQAALSREVTRGELSELVGKAIDWVDTSGPGGGDCDPATDPDCDGVCPADDPTDPDCKDDDDDVCPANDPDCVEPAEGDLEVSLNADTPGEENGETTIPLKANSVDVFCFDLTAPEDDVTVSNITITRSGPGESSDIRSAYLYEGDTRITSERTFSSDDQNSEFSLKNFIVEEGKTRTLCLVIDIAETAINNNEHVFSILSEDDVVHNAESAVGDFPIESNKFEIGGVAVADIEIEPGGSISKAKLGGVGEEVGNFKLTAGIHDVELERVAFFNDGSLDAENLENCTLMRSDEELAFTEGPVGELLTFVLEEPYMIDEGQSRNFEIECDITGGKPDQTIELYLDGTTDLKAIDSEFGEPGFGANVINNFTSADANIVVVEGSTVVLLDNGPASHDIAQNSTNNILLDYTVLTQLDVTARDTGIQIDIRNQSNPATGPELDALGTGDLVDDVLPVNNGLVEDTSAFCITDASNVGFTIGDTIKVPAQSGTVYAVILDIDINGTGVCDDNANTTTITTDLPVGDLITDFASSAPEVDPYEFVKNIKIVDLDTDDTLVDPLDTAKTNSTRIDDGGPDSYFKIHPQDYDFEGGEERNLALMVDIDDNMPSGYKVCGRVFYANDNDPDSFFKDFESNSQVKTEEVVTSPLFGECMFTEANTLTVEKANTPNSNTFVKGDTDVEALGMDLTAGDANDIRVNDLTVRFYADDDGTFDLATAPFPGDLQAKKVVSSVRLYEGDDEISENAETLQLVDLGAPGFTIGTDYYIAEFEDLDLVVDAGDTRTLTAVVDTSAAKSLNATSFLALDVNPAEDVDAEDVTDENAVTANGAPLNDQQIKDPLITIGDVGTLTINPASNPNARILIAGSEEQNVSNYNVSAGDESWTIDRIAFLNDPDGDGNADPTDAVESVTIEYPLEGGGTDTTTKSLADDGTVIFSGLDFYVDADLNTVPLKVYANLNTVDAGGDNTSGSRVRIVVEETNDQSTFNAVSDSANVINDPLIPNNDAAKTFVVRQAAPIFAKNSTGQTDISGGAQDRELYDFSIDVDNLDAQDSIDVARMTFEVTVNDVAPAGINLNDFFLEREDTIVNDADVNIRSAAGDDDLSEGSGNTLTTTDKVIVTFNTADPVSELTDFRLNADIDGVSDGDSVNIVLSDDDVNEEAIVPAGGSNTNDNTGTLIAGATGLFSAAGPPGGFVENNAGEGGVIATGSVDFIYSDQSAPIHAYSLTAGSSSDDFMNAFLINTLNSLDGVTLIDPS